MKIERLRAELEKARQKAAEWQARAKDIERQITEHENMEIIQAVRGITASPEELKTILGLIQSMKEVPQGNAVKEEETKPDENYYPIRIIRACAVHRRIFNACDRFCGRKNRRHPAEGQRGSHGRYAAYRSNR